jgi:hypothetical protein
MQVLEFSGYLGAFKIPMGRLFVIGPTRPEAIDIFLR